MLLDGFEAEHNEHMCLLYEPWMLMLCHIVRLIWAHCYHRDQLGVIFRPYGQKNMSRNSYLPSVN